MTLTSPPPVRSGSTCWRRDWAWRWLRGKNRAGPVGLALEFFFQPLPHPFAAFDFDFLFELLQGAETLVLI